VGDILQPVCALWDLDLDVFFGSFSGVVLDQLGAQPGDLHSDAGVGPGIEIRLAPKDNRGDLMLFGGVFRIDIRLFGKEVEQLAQRIRALKDVATGNSLNPANVDGGASSPRPSEPPETIPSSGCFSQLFLLNSR
jgi:hypothetical protein